MWDDKFLQKHQNNKRMADTYVEVLLSLEDDATKKDEHPSNK